jgi:hypothetical protein
MPYNKAQMPTSVEGKRPKKSPDFAFFFSHKQNMNEKNQKHF